MGRQSLVLLQLKRQHFILKVEMTASICTFLAKNILSVIDLRLLCKCLFCNISKQISSYNYTAIFWKHKHINRQSQRPDVQILGSCTSPLWTEKVRNLLKGFPNLLALIQSLIILSDQLKVRSISHIFLLATSNFCHQKMQDWKKIKHTHPRGLLNAAASPQSSRKHDLKL